MKTSSRAASFLAGIGLLAASSAAQGQSASQKPAPIFSYVLLGDRDGFALPGNAQSIDDCKEKGFRAGDIEGQDTDITCSINGVAMFTQHYSYQDGTVYYMPGSVKRPRVIKMPRYSDN